MVIYLKPMPHQSGVLTAFPQRFKNCRSPRYALCKRQQRWTDRPTDRRTDATKRIHYSPHMIKTCVGDMKWTRSVTDGKTDGHCR